MSHREEAPRQQLTAPDSSETPRTSALNNRLTFTDGHMDDFYAQMFQLARQLELELFQERERGRGLERDAMRYRYLREHHLQVGPDAWIRTGDDLDEAIDAALPSAPKE
jgi:hypothetical protein